VVGVVSCYACGRVLPYDCVCDMDPEDKVRLFYTLWTKEGELCRAMIDGHVPSVRLVFLDFNGELLRSVRLRPKARQNGETDFTLSLDDIDVRWPCVTLAILEDLDGRPLYMRWFRFGSLGRYSFRWTVGASPEGFKKFHVDP
jgi:hypothetical protein